VRQEGHVRRDSQSRGDVKSGSGRGLLSGTVASGGRGAQQQQGGKKGGNGAKEKDKSGRMGLGRMMALTVSMGGSQVCLLLYISDLWLWVGAMRGGMWALREGG
jgi:hypothetical protein